MQIQVKKKRKAESHKVTLDLTKHENTYHQIAGLQNAYFPFTPYPEQVALVSKINEAIFNCQNALIESPTGTGKTLCMLVGSLSVLCTLSCSQNVKVPKIYYLTRTHSQITQVVNELKRIPWYNCRINIIASREHLCINRNLKQLKGRMLDRGCQEICKQKLCKYKQETPQTINSALKEWMTLDQLKQKGNRKRFCPFYLSKMATEKTQITIMPFNYLLDWSLFEHNSFNLKNSVIIFDEAHNVDSLAQEGSSLQINTQILFQALTELKNLQQSSKCRYLHKKFEAEFDESNSLYLSQMKNLVFQMNTLLREFTQQKNYNGIDEILRVLKRLTNFVSHQEEFQGVDLNNYEDLLLNMDKVRKLFGQRKIECQQFQLFYITFTRIMKILDSNALNIEDYYLYIGPKSSKIFSLRLNCLNATFTFQRILQYRPRSIILCSGTLGPFQIWQKQLGIHFSSKIKVPSFIASNQICVHIVSESFDKKTKYQFSYQHKNRQDQFEALAKQFLQLQKIVPHGIVVAFSTYDLMQKAMKHCLGLKKDVFYESKNQSIDAIYSKYSQSARSPKGAFLFIVMKGKFSQGINFNDQLCRCLIVIGIPFLPPNDFKVMKKKSYIQNKFNREEAENWYYSQTFKSVNQVIGRVIRSKNDYGCVLLFDQRYGRKDITKELPNWFVSNIPQTKNVKYTERVKNFFSKQSWLNPTEETTKKQVNECSFELALSKTVLAKDSSDLLSLETLLNQQTPVKPKKPKRVLKIVSEDEVTEEKSQNILMKNKGNKKKGKIIENFPHLERQSVKKSIPVRMPWLSINYFLGDQEEAEENNQSLHKTQKALKRGKDHDDKEQASITIQTNRPRNKNYF